MQHIKQAVTQVAIEATYCKPTCNSNYGFPCRTSSFCRAEVSSNLRNKAVNIGPKLGRPSWKQLTFDWSSMDKYPELGNLKLEVKNRFQTYNKNKVDNIPIRKNWLAR